MPLARNPPGILRAGLGMHERRQRHLNRLALPVPRRHGQPWKKTPPAMLPHAGGFTQTRRAIRRCRTGHRGSKSMTKHLGGSELATAGVPHWCETLLSVHGLPWRYTRGEQNRARKRRFWRGYVATVKVPDWRRWWLQCRPWRAYVPIHKYFLICHTSQHRRICTLLIHGPDPRVLLQE